MSSSNIVNRFLRWWPEQIGKPNIESIQPKVFLHLLYKTIGNKLPIRSNLLSTSLCSLLVCALLISVTSQGWSQAGNFPVKDSITFSPRWVNNQVFLSHMTPSAPPESQMVYLWAEAALFDRPMDSYAFLANHRQFQQYCEESDISLLGGPMLGNVTSQTVDVWVRTVKPAEVSVKVILADQTKNFGPVATTIETQLSGVVRITGLQPSTIYTYQVLVNGQTIDIPEGTNITTAPAGNDSITRLAFGSCFHRWGLGNGTQTQTLLNRHPHAFIGLGDIIAQDKLNKINWHTLDYLSRDLYPAWQQLVSQVPFYALWDDHDYFGNDLAGVPDGYSRADRDNVWNVFRYAWNNPAYGNGKQGVYFRSRIGAADLIVVDHRYFRTEESLLGEEQMQWLKDQLLDCQGPFIVLATGSMWSDYVSGGKDSWGSVDPEAREEIFTFIEKNNISGVILISGDRHGSRGFRLLRPSGYQFYEFECASLGGLSGPPASRPEWDTQLYGISGGYAFGEFTFDPHPKDPTVTFRLVGEKGDILYETTLNQSQLTPANFTDKK